MVARFYVLLILLRDVLACATYLHLIYGVYFHLYLPKACIIEPK